ncbi:MAG: hypothetical protein J7623_12920 [Chitinophaga sp.]|uniref:hypothetical protein n=1 Tax=Chitinophaga sp. TaxID=1869181 RepID=UPI001B17CF44|nr:hypothetical protein [Chitinophaga sp.]MBO9729532.1 hypothetical protein [Chitinophaga sp.]
MKKTFVILYCCLIFPLMLAAQSGSPTLPKLISPSPEAASITKYGIYPVSLFTGLPSISIPVYTINVRNFSLPISFDYHGSGIKVDDYASWIGLGWNITAGGAITRTTMGVPDDDSYGSFYHPIKREAAVGLGDYMTLLDITERKQDSEPDIFYYSFAGFSGKFVFGPNREIRAVPHNNLKITYTADRLFSVVDPNGNTYLFEKTAFSTSYSENGGIQYWPVTSWYLTKIILDNKVDTLSFDYAGSNQGPRQSLDYGLTVGRIPAHTPAGCSDGTRDCTQIGFVSSTGWTRTNIFNSFTDYYVSKITFPGGRVRFVPGQSDRMDFGGLVLDSVIVENSTRVVKKMALTHDYFFSNDGFNFYASPRDKYRLKLTGINEVGDAKDSVLTYKMQYEEQYKLPPRMNCGIDWWGYYNGHTENQQLIPLDDFGREYSFTDRDLGFTTTSSIIYPAKRDPEESSMKAGMLKRIQYPTGGYTDFEFEANRIATSKLVEDPGRSYFVAAKKDDGPDVTYRTVEFVADATIGEFDVLPAEMQLLIPLTGNITQPYVLFQNLTTGISYKYTTFPGEPKSRKFNVAINQGDRYRLTAHISPNPADPNDDTDDEVVATLHWAGRNKHYEPTVQIGPGLRIKSIKSYTSTNNLVKQEDYRYGEKESGNGMVSFFPLMFTSRTYEQKGMYCYPARLGGPEVIAQPYNVLQVLSKPIFSYSDIGGSTVFYPEVAKYEVGPEGDNGKVVNKYEFELDEKIDYRYPDPQLLVSANWKSGHLLSESIYKKKDNGYQLISEVKNTYQTYLFDTTYGLKVRQQIIYPNTRNCIGLGTPAMESRFDKDFAYFEYPVVSGVKKMISSIKKDFTDNDSLQVETNYSYQNVAHLLPTTVQTVNSKGNAVKSIFRYPQDKGGITGISPQESIVIDSMVQRNMVEKLIEKEDYESNVLTQKAHYEYNLWGTSKYLLALKKFKLKLGSNASEDRFEIFDYDKYGNILEQSNSNNVHEVYLWGYNNLYPVARVLNSNYQTVKLLVDDATIQNPATDQILQTELNKLRNSATLKGTLINTYSYFPLLGLSGVTDEASRRTFYEYDGFGRLKLIKDQNGKILKLMDYQYQQPLSK